MKKEFSGPEGTQADQSPDITPDPDSSLSEGEGLESSPSDIEEGGDTLPKKKKKKGWTTKRIVIVSIVGALVLILAGGGAYAYSLWSNPLAQFNNVAEQFTTPPAGTEVPEATVEGEEPVETSAGATPTPDPYQQLLAQSDSGFLKDIVNIMLIGVDHAEERDTWSGKKSFHSDVMIVLSINQATGAVNMISLPRDTYAKIPGVKGIYKLNASIDCGGGWPNESNKYSTSGFDKVCEAASWMLGGIPVQYYYAVDMNAVKDLVNEIGGVQNFDVEMDFTMQGRSYKAGVQDMDGQAVLDYLRVRKNISDAGDLNRINRQKKMLVAIFNKIKQNGSLTSIPGMLDAFKGNLYTNTSLAQTAALAAFAYNVEPDSIGMYSMGGNYNYGIFNWNFVLTDQKARVALIKQIYGVDVEQYSDYSSSAAVAKWNRMQLPVVKSRASDVLSKVKAKLEADAKLPIYGAATPTPKPTSTPKPSATATPKPSATATPKPSATATPKPSATATPKPSTSTSSEPSASESAPESSAGATDIVPLAVSQVSGLESGVVLLSSSSEQNSSSAVSLVSSTVPTGYRKYLEGGKEWTLYNKARNELANLSANTTKLDNLKSDIESLCSMFSISVPSWKVNYESTSNEIYVDFR